MLEKVKFIIAGSEVKRFHTIRIIGEETNGHHSFLVAVLCELLSPECSSTLLKAALTHDLPEETIGDIPSPTKSAMGKEVCAIEDALLASFDLDYESKLSREELRTLKLADRLAGLIFCKRQIAMGNSLILDCHRNYFALVQDMEPFNKDEEGVISAITCS